MKLDRSEYAGSAKRTRRITSSGELSASIPEHVGVAKASAVREQIANRDLARDVRVGELEGRQDLRHAVVPAKLSFIDEHTDRGRGHRLRRRTDGEERLRIDGRGFAGFAHAVTLREDDPAVLHDSDRQSGHVPVRDGFRGIRIEIADRIRSRGV